MATRQTLRERVERKLYIRTDPTQGGTEAASGNLYSDDKINDALNDALAWFDITLIDMKDGRAWFDFTTQNTGSMENYVFSVASGAKKPILGVVYDYDGTPVRCRRIVILSTEDRIAISEGSFFQPSANQGFYADMESVGVDGIELFLNSIADSKKVKYWANVEFDQMTADADNLSLGNRLDKLMVDYSTAVCERDVPGGAFLAQANALFVECGNLAKLYNSWRN